MSCSSDEEISIGDRNGYEREGSDGDDDEEDEIEKKKKHRRKFDFGFGKRLVLNQYSKAKNQIRRVRSRKPLLSPSSLSSTTTTSFSRNVNVSSRGKVVIIQGDDNIRSTTTRNGFGCKFCFSRPNVLENPNGSPSSDPNDPKFSHSMLKNLLEKNDFYSKECNPHIESLVE